jgi:hypothetical protein
MVMQVANEGTGARIATIVDLERYPIDQPLSPAFRALVSRCLDRLAEDGCCVLKGFIRPESVARMVREGEHLAPLAHRSSERHTPYFTPDEPNLPRDHPRRTFQSRTNGFVCYDLIPPRSDLHALFMFDPLTDFLCAAFDQTALYRYADPLAAMPINAMGPGDTFPWHFDTNEFTVTVVIQPAEAGGVFEYVPNIRSCEDERYEAVQAVLAGVDDGVRRLALEPGDVQLFKGRFTLHRVTEVGGGRLRLVAIPSWSTIPDMIGKPYRTQEIYGRLSPAHLSGAQDRTDSLAD